MNAVIFQASAHEAAAVSEVLCEAAAWLEARGIPLWDQLELQTAAISADVAAGHYFLAVRDGNAIGAFKYQAEDPLIWPDAKKGDASYIHRISVRRACAGSGLAFDLLRWAANRAAAEGRQYLRLDCDSARSKLCAIYERFGFLHHSDRQVGRYHVARYEYQLTKAPIQC